MSKVKNPKPSAGKRVDELGLSSSQVFVPSPDLVNEYLSVHHDLAELLPEICGAVRRRLGANVELSIGLYQDPEIDDRYVTLYVRQPRYDKELMETLDSISRSFDDQLEGVSGYLLITTDFRRLGGSHGF